MNGPRIRAGVVSVMLLGLPAAGAAAVADGWVEPMKKVHATFTGQPGTVAQIGDSITITMAFFTPLRGRIRNVPKDLAPAHEWIRSYVKGRCWAGWKGPEWGNNGRMTSNWGAANIDRWLERMNPEVALIMFGTNDLHAGPRPPEYDAKMRKIARACIDNGTIPILYTIPPTADQLNNAERTKHVETFVASVRKLASELNMPLIDFYREMITRRPKDFPVLLGDNVHPSYPKKHQRDFSDEALRNSGYTLRNYLTLRMYWAVHRKVLSRVKSARTEAAEASWKGPTHQGLPAVFVPRPAAAPKIDGKLDDACWRAVAPIDFRRLDGDAKEPAHPTWAKVAATRDTLFVAFHCGETEMDNLISRRQPHDGDVWSDDSVEVFVKAGGEATMQYYQVTVNPAGSVYDAFGRDKAWQASAKVATWKGKDSWSVEIALPFARMKLPTGRAALAGPWRLNLTRMRPARGNAFTEEAALSPTESPSSHVPAKFAYAFLQAYGGKLPANTPKAPQAKQPAESPKPAPRTAAGPAPRRACPPCRGGTTMVLQQGAGAYSGCSTRTLRGPKARRADGNRGILCLRGSHNRFVVKFELPKAPAGRTLARARLALFLPAARKMNVFAELFCHEIVSESGKPAVDEQTDYDNGRRAGAVDSVELFAPPGPAWRDQPWLPLGVREGGEWIELNVTPLAAKWLKDPAANRGVMIVPTDCPDKRFASTWEIDIPSASAAEAAHRPKLILEFAPLERRYEVGTTHSMRRILDRSSRFAYRGVYGAAHSLSMAANEWEAFQVVVHPLLADLKNVRLTWGDLAAQGGERIPASDVECFVQEWYRLRANWKTRDVFFRGKLYETPDPLIPARPITAKRHRHTPFYIRVRTRGDTPAGTYKGTITLHADGAKPTDISLAVKVWPYAIPEQWNFHTMGQFVWHTCQDFHGKEWNGELQRKYYDFLLDHRFSPTEQYAQRLSPRQDMESCLRRGMNTVYLYSVHGQRDQPTEALMQRIRPDWEKVRQLKALDYALVYIGDETSKWDKMRSYANLVHARLPGAQVMIGGSFPRPELTGYIDIYDPQIGGRSKTYSLQEESTGLIAEAQKRGEEFYWYVAAGPAYPFPNVQVEYPLTDCRTLFWLTWKYGVNGFEYYCYNIWHGRNFAKDPAQRFPNVKWKADGWERGWPSNGDGMLFYPGPVTSMRFETIRDGIEDWESLQALRNCVEAVRHRKHPHKHRGLIDEAEKLLAVRAEVARGFREITRDPALLLAERERLGDLLARFVPVVQKTEKWDKGALRQGRAAEVRIARQTAARRRMLRQRHVKACEALKARPLPQAEWDALWPKRVLFAQDFEDPPGEYDWEGRIVTDNVPVGSRRALAAAAAKKHFARRIRVGIYWDNARAATTTWVKFKYFVNRDVPIEVFVFNMTQGDNWVYTIRQPAVGKWTKATLNVTELFRKKGGGRAKVNAGDALDDVFLHAGKPGDKDLQLLVDDVQLLGLD